MSKQALFYYDMPEGVKAALLRLQSACRRDGINNINVRFADDELTAWIRDNRRDPIRYVALINREFYEKREVDE